MANLDRFSSIEQVANCILQPAHNSEFLYFKIHYQGIVIPISSKWHRRKRGWPYVCRKERRHYFAKVRWLKSTPAKYYRFSRSFSLHFSLCYCLMCVFKCLWIQYVGQYCRRHYRHVWLWVLPGDPALSVLENTDNTKTKGFLQISIDIGITGQNFIDHITSPKLRDDVIKWIYFPRYWPFVKGIHRWDSHKSQWRRALMFSLICAWINGWVNNREAGDLRHHRAHYDVTVMKWMWRCSRCCMWALFWPAGLGSRVQAGILTVDQRALPSSL